MTKEGQNQGSPKALIFGGTTEGRMLCETCAKHTIPIIYCVASADGARPVESMPNVDVHVGRLGAAEMEALMAQIKPGLVVDATHPYAEEASGNIARASKSVTVPMLRIARESTEEQNCVCFDRVDNLLDWLSREPGNVFVTMGASAAAPFTGLQDYQSRVWMRILPSMDSMRNCLALGYNPERLICMQGPFSEDLNRAMFKEVNARILVTKNSGGLGGFSEKVRAAQSLGMLTAVLSKPKEFGVSLSEACNRIMEL